MTKAPPSALREPEQTTTLDAVYDALGPDYVPRTDLLDADGRAKYVNRLIAEPSPYLRQHAHNPVDWRPWGQEAFAEAARRNVPVFLSVGYATCHWCHVMEEESFDNEAVAAVMNAGFVPVKLDREQRPDLDQIYILATQMQQGHAGWPNSVWLTPEAKPFHTGTYFPKPQFIQVLNAVSAAWVGDQRAQILRVADQMSDTIRRMGAAASEAAEIGPEIAAKAALHIVHSSNSAEGGFSNATQFPQEGYILFLLDHWRRTGDDIALKPALAALDGIEAGGIHDHVGGGFHRYAVDVNWRTPHFEKMLYNQALLSRAFIEAWEATGNTRYARAATRCFDYVLRDMTTPEGAFYTAEDADNLDANGKREEGEFYVWSPQQALDALGEQANFAISSLGLEEAPTLEAGPVAHLRPGASVDFSALDPLLDQLRSARDARNRPIRDEKVIAGWNGLMIRALAEGGAALDRGDYIAAAGRAYDDAHDRLSSNNTLARIEAGGERREEAGLEDHAWLGLAALALFDATRDAKWLLAAQAQADELAAFDHGDAFKMTRTDGPLGPVSDTDDGAVPSGQSSALEFLAKLNIRSPDPARRDRAQRLLAALSGAIAKQPILRPLALTAAAVLQNGETGARITRGPAYMQARRDGDMLTINIQLLAGWKIAADTLALEGARITKIPAPEQIEATAGMPQVVHSGPLTISATLTSTAPTLIFQTCNDKQCHLPQRATFMFA